MLGASRIALQSHSLITVPGSQKCLPGFEAWEGMLSLAPGPWHSQKGFLDSHRASLNQGMGVGQQGSHEVQQDQVHQGQGNPKIHPGWGGKDGAALAEGFGGAEPYSDCFILCFPSVRA